MTDLTPESEGLLAFLGATRHPEARARAAAIEKAAIARDREGLVEVVAANLWETIYRGDSPPWSDSILDLEDGWKQQYRVMARRLLALDAPEEVTAFERDAFVHPDGPRWFR